MARLAANCILGLFVATGLSAQPQIGGSTCSTSTVTGGYFWRASGALITNAGAVAGAELAEFVADGRGSLSGKAVTVIIGQSPDFEPLTGMYSVNADCTGTMTLFYGAQPSVQVAFQVIDSGAGGLIAFSDPTHLITGAIYRRSSDLTTSCNNGSFSGSYGFLATGADGNSLFSESGTISSDGNGNLTTKTTVNLGGTVSFVTATGTYSVTADCSGTIKTVDQLGNVHNIVFAITEDGVTILLIRVDPNTAISAIAQPQFAAPQQAVVNGASFAPRRLAPGSLFSIFGHGFSQQTVSATSLPLPTTLAATQVLINGQPIPLDYVSPAQINAQVPLETPANTPLTIAVVNTGKQSNSAALNALSAAPGVFTYGQNQAVVQNQNGSTNSPTNPAHLGDIVVAYLTGGGPVNASGPWVTGGASPSGISPVTSSYSITVGGQQASSFYLGLTPGFVGLYQANFQVPQLSPENYPIQVTVNGVQGNGPTISIGN